MKVDNSIYVFETDVLVVGGGVSGLWAANHAREFVDQVLIVDKGPQDWGGLASMSGGDMIAMQPEDNLADMLEDLVYYYDGLCEQDILEDLLVQSHERFKDYERLGHKFARDEKGKLLSIPQRGLSHIRCYLSRPYGEGGQNMSGVLINEAERLGIRRVGRILITDIIKEKDSVVGAVGFNTQSGEPYTFQAKAIILATGLGGWKNSYHQNTSTGEGIELALRAGAELRNCEFIKVWNVPEKFAWEGQTGLLPKGARFLNASGEDFMQRYSPKLGANTDPHYNVRGMAIEAREGRGPIYFDCSQMSPEDVEIMRPARGWMKANDEKLMKIGMDFFKQKIEWMPQVNMAQGGIMADIKGRTRVDGLFTSCRARSLDTGVYMGGWSLCSTAVTGYIAGESAGRYAAAQDEVEIPRKLGRETVELMLGPLGKEGLSPKDVVRALQEIISPWDVSILKTEKSLGRALSQIEDLKVNVLPKMAASDPHYLLKYAEARSMAVLAEIYLRASLMRKESRAGHFREDYPNRDNENWLRWIFVELKEGDLSFRTEPVPLNRYKIKPHRYYMDNFDFPQTKQG
jgi:succinate dehydrogenase / fumarate reductase flavoprotein subunit